MTTIQSTLKNCIYISELDFLFLNQYLSNLMNIDRKVRAETSYDLIDVNNVR